MESRRVSLLKALSWRVIATTVTMTVAYLWSGDMKVAASIGLLDSAIKIGAYYLHERAWLNAVAAMPESVSVSEPVHATAKTC